MLRSMGRWLRARMVRAALDVEIERVDRLRTASRRCAPQRAGACDRAAVRQQPLSDDWLAIVARGLPQFRMLDGAQRTKLAGDLQIFAAEKAIVGEDGFEIDDRVRVIVASTAALLVLGLDIAAYDHVVKIAIRHLATEREGGVAAGHYRSGNHPLLGRLGIVELAWPEVVSGIARPDGDHVVIHELAHAIDHDRDLLGDHPDQRRWRAALDRFPLHREIQGNQIRTSYIADVAGPELFAVASELFFERPHTLVELTPSLFERLREIYNLDPRPFARR